MAVLVLVLGVGVGLFYSSVTTAAVTALDEVLAFCAHRLGAVRRRPTPRLATP
jgi:hypothetical protein